METRVLLDWTHTEGKEGGRAEGQGDDELDVGVLLARLDKLVAAAVTAALLALVRVVEVHDGCSVWLLIAVVVSSSGGGSRTKSSATKATNTPTLSCLRASHPRRSRVKTSPVESHGIQPGPVNKNSRQRELQLSQLPLFVPLAHWLSGPSRAPSVARRA